jgi:hypothetical protein
LQPNSRKLRLYAIPKQKNFLYFEQMFQKQKQKFLFYTSVPKPKQKLPVLCNCSRTTKGKIPYFGATVSKIKEIYYTATINS